MSGGDDSTAGADDADEQPAPGVRVRVHSGTDAESLGVIIEDFGEMHDHDAGVSRNQITNPPRRWAVTVDDGTLVFVNSDQITAEQ